MNIYVGTASSRDPLSRQDGAPTAIFIPLNITDSYLRDDSYI